MLFRAAAPWMSGEPAAVDEEEEALLPSTSEREGANLLCRIIISALTDAKQFCSEGHVQQSCLFFNRIKIKRGKGFIKMGLLRWTMLYK